MAVELASPRLRSQASVNTAAFFYGTLMTGFDRRRRAGIEGKLHDRRRGWIRATLYDLGIYPAGHEAPVGVMGVLAEDFRAANSRSDGR